MDNEGNAVILFTEDISKQSFEYLKSLPLKELKKQIMVAIIPAPGQDPTKVGVDSYNITDFTNNTMTLKVKFKNA